jgi:MoxR-like ATPase
VELSEVSQTFEAITDEIGRVFVGQDEVLNSVLVAILARGHVLLEGVPGVGKTLLVRALGEVLGCHFRRVQFTPDLMPSDVTGSTLYNSQKGAFEFKHGPVFTNIMLADEVNRSPAKTQSAMLEAMAERSVTVDGITHPLPQPHFVLATQNPLESEGTYPLPEAQLDRFFFKLNVDFPGRKELHAILERTTGDAMPEATQVLDRDRIIELQKLVREVPVARNVQDYAVRLIEATHPKHASANPDVKRFVNFGSSPRGAQAVLLASKITALFDGRFAPGIEDVKKNAMPALRHRVLLNFEGEAEGIKTDMLIKKILDELPESAK